MRCVERGCAFPSTAGSGYCLHHRRMFGGAWPLRDHGERNVEAAAEPRPEPEAVAQQEVVRELVRFVERRPKPKRARRVEAPVRTVRAALEAHLL